MNIRHFLFRVWLAYAIRLVFSFKQKSYNQIYAYISSKPSISCVLQFKLCLVS